MGGIFEEAYSHAAFEAVLEHYFADRTLFHCGVPAMVTSYDIQHRRTVFMKSWHADHSSLLCRDGARPSVVPTTLSPHPHWADETNAHRRRRVTNSPAVSAYAEALVVPDEPIAMLLALGSSPGQFPTRKRGLGVVHCGSCRCWIACSMVSLKLPIIRCGCF